MLKLTYIHHDCFLLSTEKLAIVFDYWTDPGSDNQEFPDFLNRINPSLPFYVVVSHFHKDHFNKSIFEWEKKFPHIRFVISKDVKRHAAYLLKTSGSFRGFRPSLDKVTVVRCGESFADENITVDAFGSTDIGNSYAVTILESSTKIFHAGDLNCWAWRDESTPEEISEAEVAFAKELDCIASKFPTFDLAMFPVDSRIGTGYFSGAAEFVRKIDVKRFFPMHFTLGDTPADVENRIADAVDFSRYAAPRGEYIALTHRGDEWLNASMDRDIDDSSKVTPVLTQRFFLSAGETNAERELSLMTLVAKIIDISTAHANMLGVGNPFMPSPQCGWVLSRMTIEMKEYPRVNTNYEISTWVESWNRHFSERSYAISDENGREIGFARSIWMVLDLTTHANAGLASLNMPPEHIYGREAPIARQKKHITLLPPDETSDVKGKFLLANPDIIVHRFGYSDLDAYRHVNTVRYVALLMNLKSLAEHDAEMLERLEMSFLHEGGYDRPLDVLRAPVADEPGDWEAVELRDAIDKSPVFFARIKMSPRLNDKIFEV